MRNANAVPLDQKIPEKSPPVAPSYGRNSIFSVWSLTDRTGPQPASGGTGRGPGVTGRHGCPVEAHSARSGVCSHRGVAGRVAQPPGDTGGASGALCWSYSEQTVQAHLTSKATARSGSTGCSTAYSMGGEGVLMLGTTPGMLGTTPGMLGTNPP